MHKIRVLIVDDSSLARGLLREILAENNDIEIAGEAFNGRQAVELASALKPDLITMDLEMPVMSGLDAIDEIMCSKAVPILVVSSVADAHNALEAVRRGALEVVAKPECSPEAARDFVSKVRMLAGVSVITRIKPRHNGLVSSGALASSGYFQVSATNHISSAMKMFAFASSTGGPQALAQILPLLPANFSCPVVIAQHISEGFAPGMAEWLGGLCKLPVCLAADGESIKPGVVYVSPSEKHVSITHSRRIALIERGNLDVYRPSCDVLFNSVAEVFGQNAIGIILTGMGSDGAKGIARIREKGGITIAQDEATSVIYGMNRVAVESGAICKELAVGKIADAMIRLANPIAILD